MKEKNQRSMDVIKIAMGDNFDDSIITELLSNELVELSQKDKTIVLTEKGTARARKIIRAHRIAERLIFDVLGGKFESGACEFEHTVNDELVDSICILLGHPRECPHGMPIPEGECCKQSARLAESSIIPLTELEVGHSARVAYVNNSKNDKLLHTMDAIQIRPGAVTTILQKYPCYVIECEGANIAMDNEVASRIFIWKEPGEFKAYGRNFAGPAKERGRGFGLGLRRRRRQGKNKFGNSNLV